MRPPTIRLVRAVDRPGRSGPINGQYALQRLLRCETARREIDWLAFGGAPQPGEIPWYWCWEDRAAAAAWAAAERPFIQGPNTLLLDSRRPRSDRLEAALLDAPSCRLLFTESAWYAELLRRHLGLRARPRIVLWPYPIEPAPPGPAPRAEWDLMVYAKNGRFPGLVEAVVERFRRHRPVVYGRYRRTELWETARRSRACLYLADDDRGPLALAEILLCGCPVVGLPTGAPFVEQGRTGLILPRLGPAAVLEALLDCQELDRHQVAAAAAEQFDPLRIAEAIFGALRRVKGEVRNLSPFSLQTSPF